MTRLLSGGESRQAQHLRQQWNEAQNRLKSSNFSGGATMDDLFGVYNACKEANWDGQGALPVSPQTLHRVCQFLQALPARIPTASAGAEPDGSLTLEWYRCADCLLSVSIDAVGELHYAAMLGSRRHYGTEFFVDEVPSNILSLIRQVLPA